MNWLDCPILEAIQRSKSLKAIFVVYVTGSDAQSQAMDQTWQVDEVVSACKQMVAVKLPAGSELCQQFSQIYPVNIIPSVYFIGDGGMPLEVVSGSVSPNEFSKKVGIVKELHQQQQLKTSSNTPTAVNQSTPAATTFADVSGANEGEGQRADAAPLTERLRWAEDMREERRRQKGKQKEEEERQKEMERRELGKDMAKFKEWKEDKRREQEVNEWKKDRAEERQHKDLVKQQIERDREEKAARYKKEQEEKDAAKQAAKKVKAEAEEAAARQAEAKRWTMARLQFRLPDGATRTQQFQATDTLSAVSSFLSESVPQLRGNFVMTTLFPKRTFVKEDMSRTLADLELVPSASIVVVSGTVSDSASQNSASSSGGFIAILLVYIMQFLTFLYNLVFGRPAVSEAPSASAAPSPRGRTGQQQQREDDGDDASISRDGPASSSSSSRANRPRSSYGVRRRQEGNIHRLTADDSDSESATWNGNSTQQM